MFQFLRSTNVRSVALGLALALSLCVLGLGQSSAKAAQIPASDLEIEVKTLSEQTLSVTGKDRIVINPPSKLRSVTITVNNLQKYYSGVDQYVYFRIRFNKEVKTTNGQMTGVLHFSGMCWGVNSDFVYDRTCSVASNPMGSGRVSLFDFTNSEDVESVDVSVGTDNYIDLPPYSGSSSDTWQNDIKNGVNTISKDLTDSTVNTTSFSETFAGINIQPVGILSTAISGIVKLPTLLANANGAACEPITLPEFYGYTPTVPCVATLTGGFNSTLWTTAREIGDFVVSFVILGLVVKIALGLYLAKDDPLENAGTGGKSK